MTSPRAPRKAAHATVVAALASVALAGGAPAVVFERIRPEQLTWVEVPDSYGVRAAVVLGDPSRPGVYIQRIRFPPHVMDRPHVHADDRYVTVLSGTWCTGTGERFVPEQAVRLPVGAVMHHPARGVHWDGSCTDQAVEVQVTGYGPSSQEPLDRTAPAWVQLAAPR